MMSCKDFRLSIALLGVLFFSQVFLPSSQAQLSGDDQTEIEQWLKQSLDDTQTALPESVIGMKALKKKDVKRMQDAFWKLYVQSPRVANQETKLAALTKAKQGEEVPRHVLPTGEKEMPYAFIECGDAGQLKPMFITLHGGGRMAVQNPHDSPMNTGEWNTQIRFAQSIYPQGAVYFAPRMADDRDGRWYYGYCQDAYDQVVREAIAHHNVDPNRIYLIGISEGAYTAYRLGAFMADHWAGAGSMAGGEPLANAPPENMRNLAFRADIGEHDTMWDRVGLNRTYDNRLNELQAEDKQGYQHVIDVQAGRGHGIDYVPCPKWLFDHKRNPWPQRVRWMNIDVHGRRSLQSYWLALEKTPSGVLDFDAQLDQKANSVKIDLNQVDGDNKTAANGVAFSVYLNDEMLDLNKPVHVYRNGEEVFSGKVERRPEVLLKTMVQRGDPYYSFPVEIKIQGE